MRPTSWFEISLSTSWPKKSHLSRWSRLIRTKWVPLGTVRAPLDAYGSKKNCEKKNQCVDSSSISFFFSVTGFCFSNEGGFLLLFFKKHKMSFCSLTYKKKRIYWTYWTNLSLMYCFIEIQITMSFYCSWMGPFHFFRFMFVLLREKICPNSICTYRANDLSTTFFVTTSFSICFMSSPKLFDVFIILLHWLAVWDRSYSKYKNRLWYKW